MNPLTHVFVTKRLIDEFDLKVNQFQCMLGSILPDLACLNVIPYKTAHEDALGFIHYLLEKDPEFVSIGYGMLLHSETHGVDRFTHGANGFIEQNEMPMYPIVKKYKKNLHGEELKSFIHTLIEWSCDSLLSKREAGLMRDSFANVDLERISYHIACYYGGDGKKIFKILDFMRKFDWDECTHVKGVARTWDKWRLYESMATRRGVNMMKHITTAWSLVKHNTIPLVEDARVYLKEIYPAYLDFLHAELSKTAVPHFPRSTRVVVSQ